MIITKPASLQFQIRIFDRFYGFRLPTGSVILVYQTRPYPFDIIGMIQNKTRCCEFRQKNLFKRKMLVVP